MKLTTFTILFLYYSLTKILDGLVPLLYKPYLAHYPLRQDGNELRLLNQIRGESHLTMIDLKMTNISTTSQFQQSLNFSVNWMIYHDILNTSSIINNSQKLIFHI